jgi:hypothetical protein
MDIDYLGADQQAPAGLIVDLFAPTDFDRAVTKIGDALENVLDSKKVSIINRLSLQAQRGTFLTRVISYAKETRLVLSIDTADTFKTALAGKYNYSTEDIDSLVSAYLSALQKGELAQTISQPFDYVPTTAIQEVTKSVSSGFNKVLLVGAAALVVYGLGKAYVFKKL